MADGRVRFNRTCGNGRSRRHGGSILQVGKSHWAVEVLRDSWFQFVTAKQGIVRKLEYLHRHCDDFIGVVSGLWHAARYEFLKESKGISLNEAVFYVVLRRFV